MTILALVVVVLDQAAKAWVRANVPLNGEVALWPGVVHLSHVLNRGAAWNLLLGQRWLLVAVTMVVIVVILSVSRHLVARSVICVWAIGLIMGGAVGNLFDRIAHGAVTDMIDVDTSWNFLRTFPVFNLADSALTMGVVLLLLHSLRSEKTVASANVAPVEVSTK
jgi:signal peptidase II